VMTQNADFTGIIDAVIKSWALVPYEYGSTEFLASCSILLCVKCTRRRHYHRKEVKHGRRYSNNPRFKAYPCPVFQRDCMGYAGPCHGPLDGRQANPDLHAHSQELIC